MVTTAMSTARLGGARSPEPMPAAALEQSYLAIGRIVARLGELALQGLRDPAELLSPLVGPLLSLRAQLREAGSYELADAVRRALTDAGVEVRDSPTGTDWRLVPARWP
jgi:cysteinyl-tRNA synthetase